MRMLAELQWLLLPLLVLSTGRGTHQLPTHLCLDVDVVYNKPFKTYLEGSRSQRASQAAYIIIDQANRFFQCDALAKDITITLRPRKVTYNDSDAAAEWKATAKCWYEVRKTITSEQMKNAHVVVYLTHDDTEHGKIGMSSGEFRRPVTCYPSTKLKLKAVITEVQSNSLKTANNLAHEIAHSLSIPNNESPCSGIMNTVGEHVGSTHWSQCSLDHLKKTYKNYPSYFKCMEKDCSGYYRNKKHTGCPTEEDKDKAIMGNTYWMFGGKAKWNIDKAVINPMLLAIARGFGG